MFGSIFYIVNISTFWLIPIGCIVFIDKWFERTITIDFLLLNKYLNCSSIRQKACARLEDLCWSYLIGNAHFVCD